MQLTSTTDYAIRIVCYLAAQRQMISTSELSQELSVPSSYIPKITKKLKQAGIIKACEGTNGGYMLAKKPEEYTAGEILRAAEGSLAPVSCIEDEPNACGHYEQCRTVKFWEGLWDVIIEYTDRFTLADLMKNEDIENPICKEG